MSITPKQFGEIMKDVIKMEGGKMVGESIPAQQILEEYNQLLDENDELKKEIATLRNFLEGIKKSVRFALMEK